MSATCPRCGATAGGEPVPSLGLTGVQPACWDCGMAAGGDSPTLPVGGTGPEVAYDLLDWPAAARVRLGHVLSERAIPWRWEPGPAVVVPEEHDGALEALLDELEAGELEEDGEDQEELAWEALGEDDEAGEAAQEAMAELFVAADRLMHDPWDDRASADLIAAAAVVEASPAPFGLGAEEWDAIRQLCANVRQGLEARVDEDVLAGEARALRDRLRQYV